MYYHGSQNAFGQNLLHYLVAYISSFVHSLVVQYSKILKVHVFFCISYVELSLTLENRGQNISSDFKRLQIWHEYLSCRIKEKTKCFWQTMFQQAIKRRPGGNALFFEICSSRFSQKNIAGNKIKVTFINIIRIDREKSSIIDTAICVSTWKKQSLGQNLFFNKFQRGLFNWSL